MSRSADLSRVTLFRRHSRQRRSPRVLKVDWLLICCALALLALGVVMVGSASIFTAEKDYGSPHYFLVKQLIFAGMGMGLALFTMLLPLEWWQQMRKVALLVSLGLLAGVLFPWIGTSVNGSSRWIDLVLFRFQVSELVKLLLLVYLASYLVVYQDEVRQRFSGFLKPLLLLGFAAGLMLLEPDFGAAAVLLATSMGVLLLAGVPLRYFLPVSLGGLLLLASLSLLAPYRVARLTAFLDPWADPFDSGFQLTQSLIAIGSGSWGGVGLGGSIQKLYYLPEAHTDFLFAILAEELGLIGVVTVIVLFSVLVWRIFRLAATALQRQLPFAGYLAYGIGIWIGLQAFINIGVNMGVLPTKGLTLPLMSYGGSSTLVTCIAFGLLFRIHHEVASAEAPSAPEGKL